MPARSASLIGLEYGASGQIMNRVLEKLGYLEGKPGEYIVTEKGMPFVIEKYYHKGLGGDPAYNRWWDTRSWTEELQQILRENEAIPALIAEAESDRRAEFLAKKAAKVAAEEARIAQEAAAKLAAEEAAKRTDRLILIGKIGIIVVVAGVCVFICYKTAPRIKKWWKQKRRGQKADCYDDNRSMEDKNDIDNVKNYSSADKKDINNTEECVTVTETHLNIPESDTSDVLSEKHKDDDNTAPKDEITNIKPETAIIPRISRPEIKRPVIRRPEIKRVSSEEIYEFHKNMNIQREKTRQYMENSRRERLKKA